MTEAGAVPVVHFVADLVADDRADRRAGQNRDQPVVAVARGRANCASDDGAERRADTVAIAVALTDPVVVLPLASGVADIIRIVLFPPAVCGRVRRRVGESGQRSRQGGERERRGEYRNEIGHSSRRPSRLPAMTGGGQARGKCRPGRLNAA